MNAFARPVFVAVGSLALALRAAATVPDANASVPSPPAHAEADKTTDEATQMKALLQRARDAVNTARKAGDLDPVLSDLQKYQTNGFGFGMGVNSGVAPGDQDLLQQILSDLEFVKQWQNYLAHLSSGDAQQARSDLMMISQNNFGAGLMPRSRILALMSGQQAITPAGNGPAPVPDVPEAQKVIDGINTLEDLQPALQKLNDMAPQDGLAREYAEHLAPMVEVYGDVKNGLPTSVNVDFMGGLTGAGVSIKANSLLLKFILQHYFEAYKGAPPADDETPAAYATRVKNDALGGQDWALLKKALAVQQWFYRNTAQGAAPDNDPAALDKFITGLNQNAAGQYALAVESFQNALKAGSLVVPAKFIGAQLDAIKRDHPAEYDAGMEAFLAPAEQAMPQVFFPNSNPAMYNGVRLVRRPRPITYTRPVSNSTSSPVLAFPGMKPLPQPSPPATASTNAPAATPPQPATP